MIHELYLGGFGKFAIYGVWYQSGAFISTIFIHAFMFSRVWFIINDLLGTKESKPHKLSYAAALIPIACAIFITPSSARWHMYYGNQQLKNHHYYRLQAARWIKQNSDPKTIFAAWNTGELGYFSERTFVNLDGLVNDLNYQQNVLTGIKPLRVYVKEAQIEFIVDGNSYIQEANLESIHLEKSWNINKKGTERIDMMRAF